MFSLANDLPPDREAGNPFEVFDVQDNIPSPQPSGSSNRPTSQLADFTTGKLSGAQVGAHQTRIVGPFYEVLTAEELAERWRVPATWVREQTRSRAVDPIPHVRLGRYVRFQWVSPELAKWWERRTHRRR